MKRFAPIAVTLASFVALSGAALLGQSDSAQAAETTVTVGNFWFCSSSFSGSVCETAITEGDTVVWDFSSAMATHTTTGSTWDSGSMSGGTFAFRFDDAGSFDYHCNVHPTTMMGRIVVEAAAPEPTATSPASGGETPAAHATATPASDETPTGGTTGLPPAGQGPSSGETGSWWLFAGVAAAGVALAGFGAATYARGRS